MAVSGKAVGFLSGAQKSGRKEGRAKPGWKEGEINGREEQDKRIYKGDGRMNGNSQVYRKQKVFETQL